MTLLVLGLGLFAQSPELASNPWDLLGQIGLGAVIASPFVYLWRDERKQRIAAESRERDHLAAKAEREREVASDTAPLLARTVQLLDTMHREVDMTVEKANSVGPSKSEWEFLMRRIDLLTERHQ